MADNLTITSTYAGELAKPYIQAAILSGKTLANNWITVKENVKHKLVLKKLASSGLLKAAACDFDNSTSALTLTEAILTPTNFMVNLQLCKSEFRSDWDAMATGRGFINDVVPADFASYLIAHVAAQVGSSIEYNLWQGNFDPLDAGGAPTYTDFNGLLKVIDDANSGSPDVDFAAATDSTTILTHIDQVIQAIPNTLKGSENVKLYMGPAAWSHYMKKILDSGLGFNYAMSKDYIPSAYGYEIRVCPGMPIDCILAAEPENLFFGTDLLSDQNEVKVVDTSETLADDNVRMAMRFTAGAQIGFIGDIVLGYRND